MSLARMPTIDAIARQYDETTNRNASKRKPAFISAALATHLGSAQSYRHTPTYVLYACMVRPRLIVVSTTIPFDYANHMTASRW